MYKCANAQGSTRWRIYTTPQLYIYPPPPPRKNKKKQYLSLSLLKLPVAGLSDLILTSMIALTLVRFALPPVPAASAAAPGASLAVPAAASPLAAISQARPRKQGRTKCFTENPSDAEGGRALVCVCLLPSAMGPAYLVFLLVRVLLSAWFVRSRVSQPKPALPPAVGWMLYGGVVA